MTPHGTPHNPSCKTDASCPNHRTDLMTCREAAIRYRGDYSYMKLVDAGTPPLTREVFAKPERPKVPKAPKISREPRAPRVKAEPKPRRIVGVIGPDGLMHSSESGYLRGCRNPDKCPAIAVGRESCLKVGRAAVKDRFARRYVAKPRPAAVHGTQSGYVLFKCRAEDTCPSEVAGGQSCSEAASAAARVRYVKKKAA